MCVQVIGDNAQGELEVRQSTVLNEYNTWYVHNTYSQWFHLKSHSQSFKLLQRRRLKAKRMTHSFTQLAPSKQHQLRSILELTARCAAVLARCGPRVVLVLCGKRFHLELQAFSFSPFNRDDHKINEVSHPFCTSTNNRKW